MCANRQEYGIESAARLFSDEIRDLVIQLDLHAHRGNARNLGVEYLARQAVLRDSEVHHAARERSGVVDHGGVAAKDQVPGGGEAARSGANDQHAFARWRLGRMVQPSFRAISPRKRSTA